jgi:hypothetical protein
MTDDVQAIPVSADAVAPAAQADTPAPTPEWYWADGVKGQGEPPAGYKADKFKSAADQLKAYTELERKFGAFTGAPEAYNLDTLDIDPNQLAVKELTSVAKELNMSQQGLETLLARLASAQQTEDKLHLEDSVKALGPDGERMLKSFDHWSQTKFSPEENEIIKGWVKDANDLRVLDKIRANTNIAQVPTDTSMRMSIGNETVKQVRQEMAQNLERFNKDRPYRENLLQRLSDADTRGRG